jgi:hypothetical protein
MLMKAGNKRAAMRVRAIANSCGAYPVKSCQSRFAKLLSHLVCVQAFDKRANQLTIQPATQLHWTAFDQIVCRAGIRCMAIILYSPPGPYLPTHRESSLLLVFGEQTEVRDYVFFISNVN